MSEATTEQQAPAVAHVDELLMETRSKMEAELEELRPQHEAFLRVEQILSNYDSITSTRKARKGNGARAPRGSRTQEFLALVKEAGDQGITVSQAVEKMDGINPNYLYRLAKEAEEEGAVRKENKLYFTTDKTEQALAESGKGEDDSSEETETTE